MLESRADPSEADYIGQVPYELIVLEWHGRIPLVSANFSSLSKIYTFELPSGKQVDFQFGG